MKLFNKLVIIAYFVVLYLTSTSFARTRSATAVLPIFAGRRAPYGPTTLIRTPSLDSAVFQSDRIGGNFAYSTIEGHAYTAITPFIQEQYIPTTTIQQSPTFYTSPSLSELSSYDNGNNPQYKSQQQYTQQQYVLQRQQYEQQQLERQQYEQQQLERQQYDLQQQQQQQQQYQTYNLYSPDIVRNILFG